MKKNKGYTLIEVIIVIAIMAILAGMSFATLGIINKAKYNAATTSLNNQMSSLWVKTKALSQSKVQVAPTSSDDHAIYPICMQILHNADGSYSIIYGYDAGGAFNPIVGDDGLTVVETTLPKIVTIKYTPKNTYQQASFASEDSMIVEFIKSDGSVRYGAGTYEVIYQDRTVMSVYLDEVTGNHYIK